MNDVVKKFKKGHKIHIKESQKGSFTRWCGGNVTDECIQRGKNSSNPKIRKKATFADNARHFKHRLGGNIIEAFKQKRKTANARKWKHKEGGIIKAADGTKTNFFQKAGNWISNNKDLVSSVANAGLGIISNIKQNKAIDAQIEANEKQAEVNKQQAFMNNYKEALGMQSDRSDIVNRKRAWQIANSQNYSDDKLQNENLQLQQSKVGVLDSLGGLSTDILNTFSNNKKSSNNPPSDSYFSNYVNTQYKNYGTFNSNGSMNLGNGLGTFSITGGYAPNSWQSIKNNPLFDQNKININGLWVDKDNPYAQKQAMNFKYIH